MSPPAQGTVRRFYTPYEVARHNTPSDCWISFLGGVYDITKVLQVRGLASRGSKKVTHVNFAGLPGQVDRAIDKGCRDGYQQLVRPLKEKDTKHHAHMLSCALTCNTKECTKECAHSGLTPLRFDPKTRDVKTHICRTTTLERYYTPMVRVVMPGCLDGAVP